MTQAAAAVDALLDRRMDATHEAVQHPLFLQGNFRALDMGEQVLLLMFGHGGQALDPGLGTALLYRQHGASALAWALGWSDERAGSLGIADLLTLVPADEDALKQRLASGRLRHLEDVLAVFDEAHASLTAPPTNILARLTGNAAAARERHSQALERIRALRWATEGWWPDLHLTPWQQP